jgi:hypothetical protein
MNISFFLKFFHRLALGLMVMTVSTWCWAELGGNKTEPIKDGLSLQRLQLRMTDDQYSVQELTLESGTVVKEYINASGQVFGVSWHGPFKPDLRLFLGDATLNRLNPSHNHKILDHHHASILSHDLIIMSRGMGRSFSGKALSPLLAPASLGIDQIQ